MHGAARAATPARARQRRLQCTQDHPARGSRRMYSLGNNPHAPLCAPELVPELCQVWCCSAMQFLRARKHASVASSSRGMLVHSRPRVGAEFGGRRARSLGPRGLDVVPKPLGPGLGPEVFERGNPARGKILSAPFYITTTYVQYSCRGYSLAEKTDQGQRPLSRVSAFRRLALPCPRPRLFLGTKALGSGRARGSAAWRAPASGRGPWVVRRLRGDRFLTRNA